MREREREREEEEKGHIIPQARSSEEEKKKENVSFYIWCNSIAIPIQMKRENGDGSEWKKRPSGHGYY